MRDADYMKIAVEEAKLAADMGEVPVGAVIVDKNGEVISRAHNLREITKDATAHAEILAIRKANEKLKSWRLEGCTLYVTLEPCPMCAGAILESRLSRLVYGATDVKFGAVESLYALISHEKIRAGVCEDECKFLLKKFFINRRKGLIL